MAKVTTQLGFTLQIDEDAIAPQTVNIFIFRLLSQLNYEHPITSVTVNGVTVDITTPDQLSQLTLREDKPLE